MIGRHASIASRITACRLTLADLDPDRRELRIEDAKHSGGWVHPVTEQQVLCWTEIAAETGLDNPPLFPHYRENRPWRISEGRGGELTWWYRENIAERLKLPAKVRGIYHLKRWAISSMLRTGMDPATVALFTGHLDLEQVLTYNATNEQRALQALASLPTLGGRRVPPMPPSIAS